MKCCAAAIIALALAGGGCGRSKPAAAPADGDGVGNPGDPDGGLGAGDTGDDTASGEVPPLVLPPECADAAQPPTTLVCTGLYADIVGKQLAPGVAAYAPAVPLWSDGAEKQRWISLPAGSTIDNADPNEWKFPVGTKVWKEFSRDGRRVETRLWQKLRDNYWVNATYAWNDDESAAMKSAGGDIPFGSDGDTYHIPTNDECEKCHRGRTDRLLGFEQIGLGLPGATGLTLGALVAAGRLTTPPATTEMVIGDDGTGVAAPALAWLHSNCGTTCHNGNSNASAYGSGLRMRLDATMLDGRSSAGFDTLRTAVGVMVNAPNWKGQTRIVPGDPDKSLLYHLITHRGTGDQMPPIASRLVDQDHTPLVQAWISQMPPAPAPSPDGGVDAPDEVSDGATAAPDPDASDEALGPLDGADAADEAPSGLP
ncbi:MAG TPA: hypothetical protein VNO55_18500 [Polyangia bacterium]|nr:hypothetical protein [Polyangia bacterium]